ncbi:hypothetical protein AC1031_005788 [Aphanomyces cochlioides]|nr:hypothetical protein AC1031_005788 [Aphanomyces cochlioides]
MDKIQSEDVDRARRELQAMMDDPILNAPTVDEYGDPSWGPVVLCPCMTWKEFELWLKHNEGRIRRWAFEPHDDGTKSGQVVIYSLPTEIHERTAYRVCRSIMRQICHAGNEPDLDDSLFCGSPMCTIGDRGQEPDLALTPVGLRVGGPILQSSRGFACPNVVVEVAYKNDSLPRLGAKLARWMSDETSVQVAIGIKIFPGSSNRTSILYLRGPPARVTTVAFGVPRPGPLQIAFPLALVYFGVDLPASLAGAADAEISIDLVELRTWIDQSVEDKGAGRDASNFMDSFAFESMLRALSCFFRPSSDRPPAPYKRELAHIKAILKEHPQNVVFNHVYPPVAPPSRYHTRPEYVSGRRVPLSIVAAKKWKKKHPFLTPISEWPEVHLMPKSTTKSTSASSCRQALASRHFAPTTSFIHGMCYDVVWPTESSGFC